MNDFLREHEQFVDDRVSLLTKIERAIYVGPHEHFRDNNMMFMLQSIPMMYATWEGYVYESLMMYIRELNRLDIQFNQLNDRIQIAHMESNFKQFMDYPKKFSKKCDFHRGIRDFDFNMVATIKIELNTESNVGYKVLNKLLESLAIPTIDKYCGEYRTKENNLDSELKKLLKLRNSIAHGVEIDSEEVINQSVFSRFKKMICFLMYEIHLRLTQAIENKMYLM